MPRRLAQGVSGRFMHYVLSLQQLSLFRLTEVSQQKSSHEVQHKCKFLFRFKMYMLYSMEDFMHVDNVLPAMYQTFHHRK